MSSPTKDTQQDSPSVTFGEEISGLPTVSHSPLAIKTEFEAHDVGERRGRETTRSSTYYMGSPVVPAKHKARTLVLCFDGTGDQ
jgi:hypothetical protein